MNQTINTADCEFKKARKTLAAPHSLIQGGFPAQVDVKSAHTGKVVTFVFDHEAAQNAEYWDGEQAEYVPAEPIPNVERLVIYNC
jgi:hypothetical protein